MTGYTKHIGLTLLLVFTSTILVSSTISVYNLYQFSTDSEVAIYLSSRCKSQSSISNDVDEGQNRFHLSKVPDADSEKGTVIVNNCNTSLHLLSSDTISLKRPHLESVFYNTVSLLTSQLFVHNIADPPRVIV